MNKSTNDVDNVYGRAKASRRFQLPAGIYDKWAECRFRYLAKYPKFGVTS